MNLAVNSYGIDTNWYTDTSATDHITSELDKMTIREKYKGHDQIHTANGAGMKIKHIGHSIMHAPSRNLHLKNILHVPSASKNLVSVHKLAWDNNVYLEFHPHYFLIKDQDTKQTILRGKCQGGLYPLVSSSPNSTKQVCTATKPSHARWHSRLGHPSSFIVRQVLRKNNLPFVKESNTESICDPCQQAKSHQLPYPTSTSVSTIPFNLCFRMFGDQHLLLLDATPIMSASLMISVNLLGSICFVRNLMFFQCFEISSNLLKENLIIKSSLCKLIGEESTKNSMLSSKLLEFRTMCLALMHINRMVLQSESIVILLKLDSLYSQIPQCLSNFGTRLFSLPPTSLTCCQAK